MNAIDTFKSATSNPTCRWSFDDPARNTDEMLASNRIGNGILDLKFSSKFRVPRSSTFFTIGSCFAREIESALIKAGLNVSSHLSDINNNASFELRKGVTTIYDYFNRYNIPSITRELKNIAGVLDFSKSNDLLYEVSQEMFDDLHYTAAVTSANIETLQYRRAWIRDRLSDAYRRADVIVITLGLCEAWFDKSSSQYLNVLSSPKVLKSNNESLCIRNIGFSEAFTLMKETIDILKSDGKKVILTVSPVPIQVTFINKDIIIQNFEAKTLLRTICMELTRNDDCVDYFPSFEMVHFSEPAKAWKPDGRHVQADMIQRITSLALDSYLVES